MKFNWEILAFTRFLLAFVVMTGHLMAYTDIGFLKVYHYLGSFEAIFGFLLISGFSIGLSISKNKEQYLKRRLQRIYPVYLACIVLKCIFLPEPLTIESFLFIAANIIFVNQLFTSFSLIGPAWTLALEVWLYCLAPLLIKLSFRQLYIIIYISFLSYCLYTCGRTLQHWNYYSGTQYGINLLLLSFVWVAGFSLAAFPLKKRTISINLIIIFSIHIILSVLIQVLSRYKHHEMSRFLAEDLPSYLGKVICLSAVFWVVVYNQTIQQFSKPVGKVFNLLGNISYPLYLIHSPMFHLFEKFHITNMYIILVSVFLLSFIIYWAFDFYSKKRVLKVN